MLAQMAQKSSPRPDGFFWRGDVGRSASVTFPGAAATKLPAAAAIAQLLALPAKRSRWTWPKESTNWHVSANSASDATLSLCDRNQRICDRALSLQEHSLPNLAAL